MLKPGSREAIGECGLCTSDERPRVILQAQSPVALFVGHGEFVGVERGVDSEALVLG
jgi:hypothetical protein